MVTFAMPFRLFYSITFYYCRFSLSLSISLCLSLYRALKAITHYKMFCIAFGEKGRQHPTTLDPAYHKYYLSARFCIARLYPSFLSLSLSLSSNVIVTACIVVLCIQVLLSFTVLLVSVICSSLLSLLC